MKDSDELVDLSFNKSGSKVTTTIPRKFLSPVRNSTQPLTNSTNPVGDLAKPVGHLVKPVGHLSKPNGKTAIEAGNSTRKLHEEHSHDKSAKNVTIVAPKNASQTQVISFILIVLSFLCAII